MSKKTSRIQGKAGKAGPGVQRGWKAPKVFLADLDGPEFEQFHQYRRAFREINEQRDEVADPPEAEAESARSTPDLQKAVETVVHQFIATGKVREKKAARHRARTLAAILREFDACSFQGPDDWIYRKGFKDNLRDLLLEYLSDPLGREHIDGEYVFLPTGYQLNGQSIGPFRRLEGKQNVTRLLIEALVWKSRRTLGLLWTLAEQGEKECLLRLAEIVVPFLKAINEEASKDTQALGGWPSTLPFWPVLKSPHHDLDCDHRQFLKLLHVGENFPLTIAEESRWTARDTVGRWAIHLCQEIEIMQDGHPVDEDSEPWEHKLEKLRPFSGETWEDWWGVAKGLLLHEYVDVVEIPELNKTVRSSADRKSPGRIRKRIPDAIEREVRRHIREKSAAAQVALKTARRDAPFLQKWAHWPATEKVKTAKNEIATSYLADWEEFLKNFKVSKLGYDGVNMMHVMDWYDQQQPPFGPGQKEKEFPDAFALASILAYAKANSTKVAVASGDGDFAKFCGMHAELPYFADIPTITEAFIAEMKTQLTAIKAAISSNSSQIVARVRESFPELAFYPNEDPEGDVSDVEVESVALENIRIIGIEDQHCTIAFDAEVEFSAYVSYDDPDSMIIDSAEDNCIGWSRAMMRRRAFS